MAIARNKDVSRQFIDRMAALEAPGFGKLFTDDAIIETTAANLAASGRKPVSTVLKEIVLLRSIFPNGMNLNIESIIAEDETVHVEVRGANKTPQGVEYNNRYLFILEFVDGKIKEMREYQDWALVERVLMPLWTV
jgi:ketosteroid isomerase-like protein